MANKNLPKDLDGLARWICERCVDESLGEISFRIIDDSDDGAEIAFRPTRQKLVSLPDNKMGWSPGDGDDGWFPITWDFLPMIEGLKILRFAVKTPATDETLAISIDFSGPSGRSDLADVTLLFFDEPGEGEGEGE